MKTSRSSSALPLVLSALAVVVAGCAAHRPPTELALARAAFARAAAGEAVVAAPDALESARQTLELAERRQADDPGSDETRALAYVAQRKALLAEANARSAIAERERSQAMQIATAVRRGELAEEENRLEKADDKAALDARPPSARSAKEAIERLRPFAAVSEDARGMTLRIDDSVLFEGNTTELMATARERLDRVAQAVHETRARSIVVKGFMERTTDARHDIAISRRRAETVRAYLVSRGVHGGRIRAEGLGRLDPVASNTSSEGQTENRRIELDIELAGLAAGAKR